jgi:glycosyltransferase involved in cell wall biosynthesis
MQEFMKKKITFINNGNVFGGAEYSLLNVIDLLKHSYDIKILFLGKGNFYNAVCRNYRHILIDSFKWENKYHWSINLIVNALNMVKNNIILYRKLVVIQSNVVYTNSRLAHFTVLLSTFLNRNILYIAHIRDFYSSSLFNKITTLLLISTFDKVVMSSKIINQKFRFPIKQISLIPNIVTVSKYNIFSRESIRIGIIGRINGSKGHSIFSQVVKHFKDHENLRFYVYGEPVSNTVMRTEGLTELEHFPRYNFIGFEKNMETIYQNLDIVLFPSQKPETFGRVIVETLAAGKIIITARVGIFEILDHRKNGFIAQKNIAHEYIEFIDWIIHNKSAATDIAEKGFQLYNQNFSTTEIMQKYDDLFKP